MPKVDETLLARARAMRTEATPAERKLWSILRAKRLGDVKFTRQVVRERSIPDFVARTHKLIIEVDGDTHDNPASDDKRTRKLEAMGYRVIRFTNAEVMGNLEGVGQAILGALCTAPLPNPLPGGERGQG